LTEFGESFFWKQIKDGFNASNKTGDYYAQIINYYLWSDALAVRMANCDAWNCNRTAPQATTEVTTKVTTKVTTNVKTEVTIQVTTKVTTKVTTRVTTQVTTKVTTEVMTKVMMKETTRHRSIRFISPQLYKENENIKDFRGLMKPISDNVF
jgi:hypothetical protein